METQTTSGFPSPAADHMERRLDLTELCVSHPEATFYVRFIGDAWSHCGVMDQDVCVIDRSLEPRHKDMVLGVREGEFEWSRYLKWDDHVYLQPTGEYEGGQLLDANWMLWGVVSAVVRPLR
ncbi:MAG: S24 family peptidase [Bacteroidota bacterium]